MQPAPLPAAEFERLMALARYEVLDTVPEQRFDTLTQLAGTALDAPYAFINFVDQYRVWSKSCVGLERGEAPRDLVFCAWTILHREPSLIPDLRDDARFADHPLVTGGLQLRSYAGVPIVTPDGHAVGTLCIMDTRPRAYTSQHTQVLQRLAALTLDVLTLSVRERELQRDVLARTEQVTDLKRSARHAETLAAITLLFDSGAPPTEALSASSALLSDALQLDWLSLLRQHGSTLDLVSVWDRRADAGLLGAGSDLSAYRGGVAGLTLHTQRSVFIDDYPSHPQALERFVQSGVSSVAVLALGEHQGDRYVLVAVRMGDQGRWRGSDRSLLEAAARSMRSALERASRLAQAQGAALLDSLTQLGNRRAFDDRLTALAASGAPFTAVVVDLDGMKAVNDGEGHDRGDLLLQLFAQGLRAQFQSDGALFRLGGDEFAALLDGGEATEDEVLEWVDLAVVTVRSAGFEGVGASVGVASGSGQPDDVVRAADRRMYTHKRGKSSRLTRH